MSEIPHQVNFYAEGFALAGEHRDPAIQTAIEARVAERPAAELEFQSVIDQESLNAKYEQRIADVNRYFASRGLSTSPVTVVTQETMTKAYSAAGEQPPEDIESSEGRSIHDRAVIIGDQEYQGIFGDDYILGLGLHEAAHSTGENTEVTTTSETVIAEHDAQHPLRTVLGGVASAGFVKADLRRDNPNKPVGDFWEEAYADLTRVKGLRFLGRNHDITGSSKVLNPIDGVNVTVVRKDSVNEQTNADGTVIIPAEFAAGVATSAEGKDVVGFSAPNLAAYALNLLDARVPGLYDDMEAGRTNPRKQAEAIRKIESVQPGLYRQLRDLEYTTPDFARGLALIVEATSPLAAAK